MLIDFLRSLIRYISFVVLRSLHFNWGATKKGTLDFRFVSAAFWSRFLEGIKSSFLYMESVLTFWLKNLSVIWIRFVMCWMTLFWLKSVEFLASVFVIGNFRCTPRRFTDFKSQCGWYVRENFIMNFRFFVSGFSKLFGLHKVVSMKKGLGQGLDSSIAWKP